jgi:hypothetical protein
MYDGLPSTSFSDRPPQDCGRAGLPGIMEEDMGTGVGLAAGAGPGPVLGPIFRREVQL